MRIFKKKLKYVYFGISKKKKRELDVFLAKRDLTLKEFYVEATDVMMKHIRHAEDLDKWSDNMSREIGESR